MSAPPSNGAIMGLEEFAAGGSAPLGMNIALVRMGQGGNLAKSNGGNRTRLKESVIALGQRTKADNMSPSGRGTGMGLNLATNVVQGICSSPVERTEAENYGAVWRQCRGGPRLNHEATQGNDHRLGSIGPREERFTPCQHIEDPPLILTHTETQAHATNFITHTTSKSLVILETPLAQGLKHLDQIHRLCEFVRRCSAVVPLDV